MYAPLSPSELAEYGHDNSAGGDAGGEAGGGRVLGIWLLGIWGLEGVEGSDMLRPTGLGERTRGARYSICCGGVRSE